MLKNVCFFPDIYKRLGAFQMYAKKRINLRLLIFIKQKKMEFLKKLFRTIFLTNIGRMLLLFAITVYGSYLSESENTTISDIGYYSSVFSFIALLVYILVFIFFAFKNTIQDYTKINRK